MSLQRLILTDVIEKSQRVSVLDINDELVGEIPYVVLYTISGYFRDMQNSPMKKDNVVRLPFDKIPVDIFLRYFQQECEIEAKALEHVEVIFVMDYLGIDVKYLKNYLIEKHGSVYREKFVGCDIVLLKAVAKSKGLSQEYIKTIGEIDHVTGFPFFAATEDWVVKQKLVEKYISSYMRKHLCTPFQFLEHIHYLYTESEYCVYFEKSTLLEYWIAILNVFTCRREGVTKKEYKKYLAMPFTKETFALPQIGRLYIDLRAYRSSGVSQFTIANLELSIMFAGLIHNAKDLVLELIYNDGSKCYVFDHSGLHPTNLMNDNKIVDYKFWKDGRNFEVEVIKLRRELLQCADKGVVVRKFVEKIFDSYKRKLIKNLPGNIETHLGIVCHLIQLGVFNIGHDWDGAIL